jgi:hypothetical protein
LEYLTYLQDYSLSTLSSTTISLKSHYEVREEDDLDSVTITRGASTERLIEARKMLNGVNLESMTPCADRNYCYSCRESEYGNVKQRHVRDRVLAPESPDALCWEPLFQFSEAHYGFDMVMGLSLLVFVLSEKGFMIENQVKSRSTTQCYTGKTVFLA